MEKKIIEVDDYYLERCIGKGSYGEVYYTTKQGSNIPYATKRMKRETVEEPSYLKYFINEITIPKHLFHKNIVKIEALKKTEHHYYIIMEYVNGGTLKDNFNKYKFKYGKNFDEKIVQHILRQLVEVIAFLHSKGIVHRDLKSENILLNYNTKEAKDNIDILNSELKLIDFGTATTKINNTVKGSPLTMDPNILRMWITGKKDAIPYDEKIDIWSLGIISYFLFVGNFPFISWNPFELMNEIEKGDTTIPINISAEAISFLIKMLQFDPKKRFSATELLKHPFIERYVGDFSYLDKKSIYNYVTKENLNINIKNTDAIESIINQYINHDKILTTSNTSNNSSEFNYFPSLVSDTFTNSAPLLKGKINQFSPNLQDSYNNSAILSQQKEQQFENIMNELKNKQIEFNNQNQNLYNSSPDYIFSNNFANGEYVHPFQNSMIDVTENSFKSQIVTGIFDNESKQNLSQNITKKSSNNNNLHKNTQNNNNNNNEDYNTNNYMKIYQEENSKNNIENSSMINQNEASKNINSSNNEIYNYGKFNSEQTQIMNNTNISQQNYLTEIKSNFNDSSLKDQNFNSSVPIQTIRSFYNFP